MGSKSRGGRGITWKIVVTLFQLVFVGVGSWVTYLMVQGFLHQFDTYSWPRLKCTIVASTVEENPGAPAPDEAYIFRVRYRWSVDFAEGSSDVYRYGYFGSSDIGEALRLAQTYPEGAEVPCWVNPEKANTAVLEFQSAWNVLWILFPLLFVAVGAGVIFLTWRRPGSRPGRLRKAISSRVRPTATPGWLAAFFSVFLFAGLAFLIPFFVVPLLQAWSATGWLQVPCLIEHSNVRSHSGDDGATYSVEVLYSYAIGDSRFKSSRYDFFGGSDSYYSEKRDFVDAHPAGTRTTCFVNPDDPLDAVLRPFNFANVIWGVFPLIFVIIGGAGVGCSLFFLTKRFRGSGADASLQVQPVRTSPEPSGQSFGPHVLKAAATPFGKLVGGTAIALFWNGVTGVFVWLMVFRGESEEGMGCMALFLIPFVLIGLVLLANIPYQVLAMFNPRPELTLERRRLNLGSSTALNWRFRGAARRLRRLKLTLEGTETVTYRRGTDTRRESNTFATIAVLDWTAPQPLDRGQVQLNIPSDTMHSFEADHNKVVWKLKLHGEVRRWPDVLEEFEILVEPSD